MLKELQEEKLLLSLDEVSEMLGISYGQPEILHSNRICKYILREGR